MLKKKIGKTALDCLKHAILQILEKWWSGRMQTKKGQLQSV